MSTDAGGFTIVIEQIKDYEFRVRFDKEVYPDLIIDEPPPTGTDLGPSPTRILAAAVGDCLAASLVYCLRRARIAVEGIAAEVQVKLARNDRKRLRVSSIDVRLNPKIERDGESFRECLEIFEDFCVVTQSVREGVEVRVEVDPTFTATS